MTTGLSASLEDYLQAIFRIQTAKRAARPTDIALALGVNNSSVTGALRTLSARGMVNYAPYDVITLTPEGKRIAVEIARRHDVLVRFFTRLLRADDAEADRTACRVEHVISADMLDRLLQFVEFVELCPRAGEEWVQGFWERRRDGTAYEACEACLAAWAADRRAPPTPWRPAPLTEQPVGGRGKIGRIDLSHSGRQRLARRGLRPQAVFQVTAADENGMDIAVAGHQIHLRRPEAERIRVRPFSSESRP
jgi:DtxR family Mn-dependent transcriptional regulator